MKLEKRPNGEQVWSLGKGSGGSGGGIWSDWHFGNGYCENYKTDNRLGSIGSPQWDGIESRKLRVGCPSR